MDVIIPQEISYAQGWNENLGGRTLKLIKTDQPTRADIEMAKSLEAIAPRGFNLRVEEIQILNHPNFEHLNSLILAAAFIIRRELEDTNSALDQDLIEHYVDKIYDYLNKNYNKTHNRAKTLKRMAFSIASYIFLIQETEEQVNKSNNEIKGAFERFSNPENFNQFLNYHIEEEKELDKLLEQNKDKKPETKEGNELPYKFETNRNGDEIIVNTFLSAKEFVELLSSDIDFINYFTDYLTDIADHFQLYFIPFNEDTQNIKISIIPVEFTKGNEKKYKSRFNNQKLSVTFKQGKEQYVIPTFSEERRIHPTVYSNMGSFLSSVSLEQRIDFLKLVGKTLKKLLKKKLLYVYTPLNEKWLSVNISYYPNRFETYFNIV